MAERNAEWYDEDMSAFAELRALRNEVTMLRNDNKNDNSLLRSELKQSLVENNAELMRWVLSVGILQTGLIATLLLRLLA